MKQRRIPDLVLLPALAALGFALGRLQTSARNQGRIDPLSGVVQTLVNPASRALSASAGAAVDFASGIASANRLESENRRLRQIEASTETYSADVRRLQDEIDALRGLGGWQPDGPHTKQPADVIGVFQLENRITLDVGSQQGIKRGMPVLAAEGLIGRIETVSGSTSQALLISSSAAEARVSAIVERTPPNPPPAGLIRGEGPSALRMELADPTATVESGDLVVTSGFSPLIPRGIVIGRVVTVQDDEAFGKRTAVVFPRATLGRVREVVVVK